MVGKTTRILIVEDNELMRDGLRAVLERVDGFTVVGDAEDGISAVELAQSLIPDVIIMDVGLPFMNGIDATREIKKLLPGINIVMLTSHDRKEELYAALSAGAAGYCLKDCASDRIKIAVSSVSEGAAWIDPRIAGLVLRAFDTPLPVVEEPAAAAQASDLLSQREREVLRLMVDGASNKDISEKLIISLSTVRTHVEHILEKLAVKGRTAAAVKAMKEGLI
ncbi:MAG: response regulator transcription factor [Cyanobacteria bacterium SZAS TMP-1]|nr:response regulator transcription factor [Cyanobacteria bacterium SZAS TMP-1]